MALSNIAKQAIAARFGYAGGGAEAAEAAAGFAINWRSVAAAAFLGGCCMAPVLHLWYLVLNKYVSGVVRKTLVDQLLMAWVFNTYAQFILATLNGEAFVFGTRHVRLVLLSWLWWIPVKGVMFAVAPEHLWLPCSAAGSFGWNLIMFMFTDR